MFKIGDFARLGHVSIKTLRYYDEIGLLRPSRTDADSGYRYYGTDELLRLWRIFTLKELGFTLEQIGQLLDGNLDIEQLRGMFTLRRAQLEQEAESIQLRLEQMDIRLRQLETEGKMSVEITLKRVESLTIISAREIVPTPELMRERCTALVNDVCAVLEREKIHSNGLCLALYHDSAGEEIAVEMAFEADLHDPKPRQFGNVQFYTLPAVETMASALYRGSYDDFAAVGQVYAELGNWIDSNGYRVVGSVREIYIQPPNASSRDGVMEIQYPVVKR